jgi:hypothetical protein
MVGHEDFETTLRYAHVSQENLKGKIDQFKPLTEKYERRIMFLMAASESSTDGSIVRGGLSLFLPGGNCARGACTNSWSD